MERRLGVKKHKPTRPTAVVWEPERVALWRATGWRPPVAVWDEDLLAEFFDKIEDHPLAPVFRLMALSGPRRGEVCCLQGDDFDFVAPYVHITKQMHGSGRKTWISPPKSPAGVRYAPLDDLTNTMCQDTWRKTLADPRRETLNLRGHVFIQPNGRPVTPDYLTRHFTALVRLHGMPPIRLHDLRHQAASMLGAAGVEPKITQGILGHSSAVTTVDTYWQVFRTLATAAVNASADLLRSHAAKRRHLGAAKLA